MYLALSIQLNRPLEYSCVDVLSVIRNMSVRLFDLIPNTELNTFAIYGCTPLKHKRLYLFESTVSSNVFWIEL